ncbi:FixH family protein [Brevibacillus sp. NRS-1366]|uniref:FixH family protein n=1 Tax=Brevibacillus sp. NRS-1366 TaxID=3233899 RepID=UPI003D2467AC
MKRYLFILLCTAALVATACGKNNSGETGLTSGAPVEAAFSFAPAEPVVGEAITFSVKVTQEGKPVDDAKEVKFEWWKDGQEKHETIPASLKSDGTYTAEQTISEPGSYFVYYHVTARDFHNMQKTPFTVKGSAGEHAPGTDAGETHQHGNSAESDHQVDFHFMPADGIKANVAAPLTVHLMRDNQAFAEASVKFEFWQGNDEKHTFVDAAESKPGQYENNVSFPASGSYNVKVHVEKGDVHDHKEFPLTVQ